MYHVKLCRSTYLGINRVVRRISLLRAELLLKHMSLYFATMILGSQVFFATFKQEWLLISISLIFRTALIRWEAIGLYYSLALLRLHWG